MEFQLNQNKPARKVLYRVAQVIILLVIFYFLGKSLFTNWTKVRDYHWELNYPLLIISFFLFSLVYLFLIKVWLSLLKKVGSDLSFWKMFKIWFISNIGKYLPGKVWTVVGMIYLLEKEGVPKRNGLTTSIIGQALSVLSAFILSFTLLGFTLYEKIFSKNPGIFFLTILFSIAVLIIVAYPKLLQISINLGLSLAKKERINLELRSRDLLLYLAYYIFSWFLFGLAFMVFIQSITQVNWNLYFSLTGAFAFSLTIGFLAVFVPGGLGVREGILVLLLSLYFPLPVATLISIFSRLYISIVELGGFLVSWAIK
ncbi:MAG: lysylphosphatidylglycerol synthase transmembrane domain-containing protein [candidate division Zixibacteria bacterium]|nr:lysylphosphatidylglycerol synthase transmembrane domain-containing protein [candidate division Zixibacteria bacterium]